MLGFIPVSCALNYLRTRGVLFCEVHGGIAASLLDITLSQAVRSTLERTTNIATIWMTMSYLAPAVGVLVCHGNVVRAGRTVTFAEGEVTDGTGRAVSRAAGTYWICA
jgi:uncharacterized protein (TIGR00369 family)